MYTNIYKSNIELPQIWSRHSWNRGARIEEIPDWIQQKVKPLNRELVLVWLKPGHKSSLYLSYAYVVV